MIKFTDVGVQIEITSDEQFLKVRETLSRIGIESRLYDKKVLYQTANILQKRGMYRIVHFKELFGLDGRVMNIDERDNKRVNSIAKWLQSWNITKILGDEPEDYYKSISKSGLKIIKYSDLSEYTLKQKYKVGVIK